ncbi:hypothetical protein SELMODRAFT_413564 [Selaginella moellendorffii]|uniref:Uncharacterized protein n=1 Tax=Selaginella moellendorffii TaxID=88036 RepID=D8RQN7_SELML|nr:hypothetical protein SELMODRAFT_413564 [Selaginella moellendorffii]
MEEGLLDPPKGEYDLADIYQGWKLGRHWIIWRQFFLNLVSHCYTAYGIWMGNTYLPPLDTEFRRFVGVCAVMVACAISARMLATVGRKKAIAYGCLVAGISGICSTATTNLWVVLPFQAIQFWGFATPSGIVPFDDWYGCEGVLLLVRAALYGVCMWYAQPIARGWQFLGAGVALVYALLVHVYMLESPLEILRRGYGLEELKTQQLDMQVIEAIQDKAIQALEKFAKATGNDLPADIKSLKPEYIKLLNQY